MVTMQTVAKYANVSKMTVSRVLSGNGYVKEETRQAVLEAVRELGYRPNLLAKGLVTGRSQIIAYVLPDICDPFFGKVVKGVTDVCAERGYNSIVSNTFNEESVETFLNMAIDRKLDGVVFHHLCIRQEQVDLLRRNHIQVVLIDNEYPAENVCSVHNDNYGGARMIAEHLIQCGYRRIAYVRGGLRKEDALPADLNYTESFQQQVWEERTAGFMDALKNHGLEPFDVYYGRGSAYMDKAFQCGQMLVREMLSKPQWPDAIYCQSDMIALGVLGELLERGISVPEKIAVCGHDGLDTCRHLFPRITTATQPQEEMGRKAAELLIAQIEKDTEKETVLMPSELFLGDTTGK